MQINDSFEQLMLDLRSVSRSKRDQGTKLELLMQKYFQTSPLYSEIYEQVWRYKEYNLTREVVLRIQRLLEQLRFKEQSLKQIMLSHTSTAKTKSLLGTELSAYTANRGMCIRNQISNAVYLYKLKVVKKVELRELQSSIL